MELLQWAMVRWKRAGFSRDELLHRNLLLADIRVELAGVPEAP